SGTRGLSHGAHHPQRSAGVGARRRCDGERASARQVHPRRRRSQRATRHGRDDARAGQRLEHDAVAHPCAAHRDLPLLRSRRRRGGDPPDGRARRDTPPRRARRRRRAVARLVDSLGLRHQPLRLLLGDGRREPGLRRHASRRHEGTEMTRLTMTVAAAALFGTPLLARAQSSTAEFTVRAVNRLATARPDETIGIPWTTVRGAVPSAAAGQLRVRDAGSGLEIPSQAVDDDGDGTTDELIFQSTFAPHETRRFIVEARAPAPVADTRVYVAWESDRIGYRIYGQGLWKVDSLNSSGVDVWVKRVRTPIVDKWYAKGHDEYHHDNGEGADFFDVGESLGAGGTGIWRNDSLYRALNFKSWRIIANGPVRTIFELTYQPFDAGGLRVSEVKRIALDAGHNLNHVVSTFKSDGSAADI